MLVLNTYIANLRTKVTANMQTATASLETELNGHGSLSSETASVLIFEVGQELPSDDKIVRRRSVYLQHISFLPFCIARQKARPRGPGFLGLRVEAPE